MVVYKVVLYGYPVPKGNSPNRDKSTGSFSKTYYVKGKVDYDDVFRMFERNRLKFIRDKDSERDRVTIGIEKSAGNRKVLSKTQFQGKLSDDLDSLKWHKEKKDHSGETPRVPSKYKEEYYE